MSLPALPVGGRCPKCAKRYAAELEHDLLVMDTLAEALALSMILGPQAVNAWERIARALFTRSGATPAQAERIIANLLACGVRAVVEAADAATRKSRKCPRCGTVTHHPKDLAEGYCARCHAFTGAPVN